MSHDHDVSVCNDVVEVVWNHVPRNTVIANQRRQLERKASDHHSPIKPPTTTGAQLAQQYDQRTNVLKGVVRVRVWPQRRQLKLKRKCSALKNGAWTAYQSMHATTRMPAKSMRTCNGTATAHRRTNNNDNSDSVLPQKREQNVCMRDTSLNNITIGKCAALQSQSKETVTRNTRKQSNTAHSHSDQQSVQSHDTTSTGTAIDDATHLKRNDAITATNSNSTKYRCKSQIPHIPHTTHTIPPIIVQHPSKVSLVAVRRSSPTISTKTQAESNKHKHNIQSYSTPSSAHNKHKQSKLSPFLRYHRLLVLDVSFNHMRAPVSVPRIALKVQQIGQSLQPEQVQSLLLFH